jgi:mRNA interferase RelE/StbE
MIIWPAEGSVYRVALDRKAQKDLDMLRGVLWRRIRDTLLSLQTDPRPVSSVKLEGIEGAYRTRVSDYRIIYEVDDVEQMVVIRRVRHRRDVYRNL